jgi:hypothetical protein
MKKKRKILIPVFIISSILLLLVATFIIMAANGLSVSTGRFLISRNGKHIITGDGIGTVSMSNFTGSENPFAKLTDGDKILIIHDGVAASYPGLTGVYLCIKISDGEINDISESTLIKLNDMGWITYDENKKAKVTDWREYSNDCEHNWKLISENSYSRTYECTKCGLHMAETWD